MLSASLSLSLNPQFQPQSQIKSPLFLFGGACARHAQAHAHVLHPLHALRLPLPRSHSFNLKTSHWSRSRSKSKSKVRAIADSSIQFTDKDRDKSNGAASTANDFLRYNTTTHLPNVAAQLQTSIVTYKKTRPWRFLNPNLQVDLVSAIHIADKQYFDILQDRLATYDCVLYEGVGDRDDTDTDTDTHMEGLNITSLIQRLLARILSLDFQLDCINYKCPNWYNADLDWDTFERLQEERGETFLGLATNALGSALKSDEDSTSVQSGFDSFRSSVLRVSWIIPMPLAISVIISLTCSTDDNSPGNGNTFGEFSELGIGSAFKVFLARPMISMFGSELFTDLEEDSVIIGERNKAALEELNKAIARGDKRVAIFYGAGHMPDLDRRLRHEFNMVPTDVDWVTAWAIRKTDSNFLGLFFEKYVGRFLPFRKEMGGVFVLGSVFFSVLLLDLWLWWSAFNVAYQTGFQMIRLAQALVIM